MASRPLKLIDATTLATSPLVRYPLTGGKVIQGKTRHPSSRAADTFRERETARLKRALQSVTHGRHIFAYNHIRTNQVVYSLSRTLQNNQVLSQLIYHGKKTVPAKLRKDNWTPYFSLHFPSASAGLEAYKLLREFSVRRQLSPPVESITVTDEFLERKRPRDPLEIENFEEEWSRQRGKIMNRKMRARVLMDQKATSVADVAAVLAIQCQEAEFPEDETESPSAESGFKDGKKLSNRTLRRRKQTRQKQEEQAATVRQRIAELEQHLSRSERAQVRVVDSTPETQHMTVPEGEVRVFWVDPHDAQYAQEWPKHVVHGQLKPMGGHIIDYHLAEGPSVVAAAPAEAAPAVATETSKGEGPAQPQSGLERLKFWKR